MLLSHLTFSLVFLLAFFLRENMDILWLPKIWSVEMVTLYEATMVKNKIVTLKATRPPSRFWPCFLSKFKCLYGTWNTTWILFGQVTRDKSSQLLWATRASHPTLLLFGQETRVIHSLNCYLGKKPGTSHPNFECFDVLNTIWARNPGQVTPLYCYLGMKPGTSHPTWLLFGQQTRDNSSLL